MARQVTKHRTIQGKRQADQIKVRLHLTPANWRRAARIWLDDLKEKPQTGEREPEMTKGKIKIHLNPEDRKKLAKAAVDITLEEAKKRARKPKINIDRLPAKRKPRKKYNKGPVKYRSKDLDFSKEEIRRRETRKLIRKLAKEKRITTRDMATLIESDDFRKNNLGLVMNHHGGSPYRAVIEAYPKWNLMPWDMKNSPKNLWKSRENRVAAVGFVIRKSHNKKPKNLTREDFINADLETLINKYRVYPLLVDAGYAYSLKEVREHGKSGRFSDEKLYPWQLASAPNSLFKKPVYRRSATKWLVWSMNNTDPKDIMGKDFDEKGLQRLLTHYYKEKKGGYKAAFREAGFKV